MRAARAGPVQACLQGSVFIQFSLMNVKINYEFNLAVKQKTLNS